MGVCRSGKDARHHPGPHSHHTTWVWAAEEPPPAHLLEGCSCCWQQHWWYLVLEDLVGHQLLQEVAMDGVARLCPAARGGPLQRDKAERAITCLNTWGQSQQGHRTRRAGLESQGAAGAGLGLAQSSGEAPAPADPGAGTCEPQTSPKGQGVVPPCQDNGEGAPPHPIPPSCESGGTAGDSVPDQDTSLSVAPAGTTGHSSSAGPAGTEGQEGSPGHPSQEKISFRDQGIFIPLRSWGRRFCTGLQTQDVQ